MSSTTTSRRRKPNAPSRTGGAAKASRNTRSAAKEAVPTSAPESRPRDRAATEERILRAVGEVLARDGFKALGVSSVAKEAGVDKVLIYRYFGGLPELLRTWGASGRFWPRVQDLLREQGEGFLHLPAAERWARFMEHFIDALRQRPLTLAVLAAEVDERNELTAILEAEREEWGEEAARVIGRGVFERTLHLRALTIMQVAAVQYLLLRARSIRIFGGIDIQSDAGWAEFKGALRALAAALIPADAARPAPS